MNLIINRQKKVWLNVFKIESYLDVKNNKWIEADVVLRSDENYQGLKDLFKDKTLSLNNIVVTELKDEGMLLIESMSKKSNSIVEGMLLCKGVLVTDKF